MKELKASHTPPAQRLAARHVSGAEDVTGKDEVDQLVGELPTHRGPVEQVPQTGEPGTQTPVHIASSTRCQFG